MIDQSLATSINHQSQLCEEPDWTAVSNYSGVRFLVCGHFPCTDDEEVKVYVVNNPNLKGLIDTLQVSEYESLALNRELVHVGTNGSIEYTEFYRLR